MEDEVTVSRIHSRKQYNELFQDGDSALCLDYHIKGYNPTTKPFKYKGIGKYVWYRFEDRYGCGRQSEYYLYFLSDREQTQEISRIEKEILRLQNLIEDIKKD